MEILLEPIRFFGWMSKLNRLANTAEILGRMIQEESGKRQFYRPIYSIHKWWARRSGTQFRAIIIRAVYPKKTLFRCDAHGDITKQSAYLKDHDMADKIILDPFMGGGTTIVEALRLGAKVVGCDLNPMAHWIVRETVKDLDLKKLDICFEEIGDRVESEMRQLYGTKCDKCGSDSNGLYFFWVREIDCRDCGKTVSLFSRSLINEGTSRTRPISPANPATVVCYRCTKIGRWDGTGAYSCVCGYSFDPHSNIYGKGKYSCMGCNAKNVSLVQTITHKNKIRQRLYAIEYWCPDCKKRRYKSSDSLDLKKISRIKSRFLGEKENMMIPEQEIMMGNSSRRWINHGIRLYSDVFNVRQFVAFDLVLREILKLDEGYRNAFLTIFTNSLEYNNMMTPYNYPHRKLHHLFNYHALPLTLMPVENNFWGFLSMGAGTFSNCYKRYVSAKKYCEMPFEKIKRHDGEITTISSKKGIEARLVKSFSELEKNENSCLLLNGDSSKIKEIPDKSVDHVITDPPYFDNIHYSELSNFFYVWLKTILGDEFTMKNVPTENEAVVNPGMGKSEEYYGDVLAAIFTESFRVIKDDGSLVFTFHHTNITAWWVLLNSICRAGFFIDDTLAVDSEYKVNPHIRNKSVLDSDLVITCLKRTAKMKKGRARTKNGDGRLDLLGKYLHDVSVSWDGNGIEKDEFVEFLEGLFEGNKVVQTGL